MQGGCLVFDPAESETMFAVMPLKWTTQDCFPAPFFPPSCLCLFRWGSSWLQPACPCVSGYASNNRFLNQVHLSQSTFTRLWINWLSTQCSSSAQSHGTNSMYEVFWTEWRWPPQVQKQLQSEEGRRGGGRWWGDCGVSTPWMEKHIMRYRKLALMWIENHYRHLGWRLPTWFKSCSCYYFIRSSVSVPSDSVFHIQASGGLPFKMAQNDIKVTARNLLLYVHSYNYSRGRKNKWLLLYCRHILVVMCLWGACQAFYQCKNHIKKQG